MNASPTEALNEASVTPVEFTQAMGAAATGVTIVTTDGVAGRMGLTVSALTAVSAEPPLLLACLNRKNPSVGAITQNGRFAANILGDMQHDVAQVFAGRPVAGGPYDFSRHEWTEGRSGVPLLKGAAATFECEIESIHDAGTHRIFIGRVTAVVRGSAMPLLYSNRRFGRLVTLETGGGNVGISDPSESIADP